MTKEPIFNSDFYVTAASVIPVIFLGLILEARLSRFWVVVRLCGCKGLVKMSPRPHLLVIPNVICGVEFSGLTGFLAFRVVSRVPAARGLTAGDARVGFRGCRQGTCPSSRLAVARLQVRFHVGIWGR
jgi:hypothetical protein